jgi:hypothetical protein
VYISDVVAEFCNPLLKNNGGGYLSSLYVVFVFHAVILLSHAMVNNLSITWLSFFGQLAAVWNMFSGGTGEKIKGGPSKHSPIHKFGNSHNVSNIQLLFMTI